MIGKSFLGNEELEGALEGNIGSEIEEPIKEENVYETGYQQLMEMYVPIFFEDDENPAGVVEVYFKLDSLNAQVRDFQLFLGRLFFFAFTLLFIGLFWIFRRASKKNRCTA